MEKLSRTLWYLCLLQVVLAGVVGFLVWDRMRPRSEDPIRAWLSQGSSGTTGARNP